MINNAIVRPPLYVIYIPPTLRSFDCAHCVCSAQDDIAGASSNITLMSF